MDIWILYENKDKLVIEQKGDMKIKSVEMGYSRINKRVTIAIVASVRVKV